MKKTDKISFRQKSKEELQKLLLESKKKLVELKSKLHTGNLKDTASITKTKYEIALFSTLLEEKQHE